MQAARGTSVDPVDEGPDGPEGPVRASRSGRRARLLLAVVALALYGVDVLTKVLAVEHLRGEPDVPVVGEVLQLRFATNPGAAFSAGTAFTEALTVFAMLAALAVLWTSRRVASRGWAVALGLLLAGIVGNLTDRMLRAPGPFRGEVVDFLMLPNWPIFNVADMCINVGAALVLVLAWRGIRLDGTRVTDADADADATGRGDEAGAEAGDEVRDDAGDDHGPASTDEAGGARGRS